MFHHVGISIWLDTKSISSMISSRADLVSEVTHEAAADARHLHFPNALAQAAFHPYRYIESHHLLASNHGVV